MIAQFKQVCAMKSGKSTCNFLYDTTHSQEHNIMHELYIFHKHKKHTFGILESSFHTTSFQKEL